VPASSDLVERLDGDGFVVLPAVLSPDEVAQLRLQTCEILEQRGTGKSGGKVLPNAAVEAPEITWVFLNPAILEAVTVALGATPVFTMEADLHRNFVAGKWHKDSGEQVMERGYFDCDPIGNSNCRVLKVALYLEDHIDGSGLHVCPGSHRSRLVDAPRDFAIPTKAGDAVLFDVRITHRGVEPSATDYLLFALGKVLPESRRGDILYTARKAAFKLMNRPERVAVYFAYGLPGEATTTFARRNMARQLSQRNGSSARTPVQVAQEFRQAGLPVVALD
jgi:hypothetical protein